MGRGNGAGEAAGGETTKETRGKGVASVCQRERRARSQQGGQEGKRGRDLRGRRVGGTRTWHLAEIHERQGVQERARRAHGPAQVQGEGSGRERGLGVARDRGQVERNKGKGSEREDSAGRHTPKLAWVRKAIKGEKGKRATAIQAGNPQGPAKRGVGEEQKKKKSEEEG